MSTWAINGLEVPASVARSLAYAAAGGKPGVVAPADLKVTATPTPSSKVRVAPGAINILGQHPGQRDEMYVYAPTVQQEITINATGSSGGHNAWIIAMVDDPQYSTLAAGNKGGVRYVVEYKSPSDPITPAQYRDYWHTNGSRSAEPIAVIRMPANTATITDSMIQDLRAIGQPRSERVIVHRAGIAGEQTTQGTPLNEYVNFPSLLNASVDIPSWATRMTVICHISGILIASTNIAANGYGGWRIKCGSNNFDNGYCYWDIAEGAGAGTQAFAIGGELTIPANYRGTTQPLTTWVNKTTNTAQGEVFLRKKNSLGNQIIWDITFHEAAI
jgi:hypothetical protein